MTEKSKPIAKQYPCGFSFWETAEYGAAIMEAAEESGLNASNWLRQTIRMRLRAEGWVTRAPRQRPQPNNGMPHAP